MLPRTPYSDTVQGSLSWAWMFSDLRNILHSAKGTWRHGFWPSADIGRAERPRESRKRSSWLFISSTCERAQTPRTHAASSARGVMFGFILDRMTCIGSSSAALPPQSTGRVLKHVTAPCNQLHTVIMLIRSGQIDKDKVRGAAQGLRNHQTHSARHDRFCKSLQVSQSSFYTLHWSAPFRLEIHRFYRMCVYIYFKNNKWTCLLIT